MIDAPLFQQVVYAFAAGLGIGCSTGLVIGFAIAIARRQFRGR